MRQSLQPLLEIPGIYWALVGLLVLLGIASPNSVQPVHLLDFTRQGAALIIVAFGQTIVMIASGLDLSVGSIVILIDVVAAQMIAGSPDKVVPVILFCLLIGAGVGLINGIVVTRLRVAPFIATLGMSSVVLGAALVYSGGAPRGNIPEEMRFWATGFFGPVPSAAVVWVVFAVIAVVFVRRTAFGRYLYAIGANPVSARLSGVRVELVTVLTYVISGLAAALAGLVLAAYLGVGTLKLGDDYMLNSIAAAVLGGTPFEGGRGSLIGTIGGALFLYVLFSLIPVIDIPVVGRLSSGGRLIAQGAIFVVAVALYARRRWA
ncbi:MAG: ABC transporter permease [Chloroflexi bacterium]|nr:ABC transporter permease [Chloroflexota bacterium]